MILELVAEPETDIIAALGAKCERSSLVAGFGEDPRVHRALDALENASYDLEPGLCNLYSHLCFYDDTWVRSYLLRQVGRVRDAEACDVFLLLHDPFRSANPVVKGLAYCGSLESAGTAGELEQAVAGMDIHVGKSDDPILGRMYAVLSLIAGRRMAYLERLEQYEKVMMSRIMGLVSEGDSFVRDWQFSEALRRYDQAAEIAKYQLRRDDLHGWLSNRLREVAEKYGMGVRLDGADGKKDAA